MNNSNYTNQTCSSVSHYEVPDIPNATATVTRVGVVQLPYGDQSFLVNTDDIEAEIMQKIEEMMPKKDYSGKFAGRVTITVELLGEIEDGKNV